MRRWNACIRDASRQVLFLSDILPTGYMAAVNAEIDRGSTVAIFGAGPVGTDGRGVGALARCAADLHRMGQTHTRKFQPELLEHIAAGRLHPERIISHDLPLTEVVRRYELFNGKQEQCRKVVLHPS